jgi:hypothetical protein
LKWVGGDKAETKLELQNEVSYKYVEHNLGTVQIPRLVARRVYSIILPLFFAHSVRLRETPYRFAVISYWLNRRKTEKDY